VYQIRLVFASGQISSRRLDIMKIGVPFRRLNVLRFHSFNETLGRKSTLFCVHPGVVLLGNRSWSLSLYDLNLNGISAQELATAYSMPLHVIEERIEAVRLCLKYQVKLALNDPPPTSPAQMAA
jgi:hypothetical protein